MRIKINRELLIRPIGDLSGSRYGLIGDKCITHINGNSLTIKNESDLEGSIGGSSPSGVSEVAEGSDGGDSGDGDPDSDRRRSPPEKINYIYQTKSQYILPNEGFVRLRHILKVIPISKSTWWSGVKSGRYPKPIRSLGTRITAWRAEDIHALIKNAA